MRNKKLLLCIASILLSISSCAPVNNNQGNTPFTPEEDPVIVDPEPLDDDFVDPNSNPIQKPETGTTTINIYAFNDFHGAVEEENGRMGLATFATYLRERAEEPNTLILDQGDTWQGSLYSNVNHGRLLNDVFSYAHVSARTVGNHDFDWGLEALRLNTARSYAGYKIPVLAANVYDYDFATKTIGNIQQEDLGVKSVQYTLKNGVQVGIVGTIGMDQITSITSSYTTDICFVNHINVIKEEATSLRENGCDVVIATCHTGQEDMLNNELSNYVDLVLCGHTHHIEEEQEDGLHYFQFGSYGQAIGKIELQYDYGTRGTSFYSSTALRKYDITVDKVDSNIVNLINHYGDQCSDMADEVVASNVEGNFYSNDSLPNLVCKAMYDQCILEKKDVILTYCNNARSSIRNYGSWTYADLYQALPFDNIVMIIEVTGRDVLNQVKNYNYVYFNPSFNRKIDSEKKYHIAVIDYLAYHTNTNRELNYFPSFNPLGEYETLSLNYRVILKNWLKSNGYNSGKMLDSLVYSNNGPYASRYNRESIMEI